MTNARRTHQAYSTLLFFLLMLLCGRVVFAQDNRHPPDILGVTLSMTREQAVSYLQANHGAGQPQPITQFVAMPDYKSPDIVVAYDLDITPPGEKYSQPGVAFCREAHIDFPISDLAGSDHFCIEVSPLDNNDILAIKRVRVYPATHQPLSATFKQSVLEKYGKPAMDSSIMAGESVWSWSGRQPSSFCEQRARQTADLDSDTNLGEMAYQADQRSSKLERSCSYIMLILIGRGKTDEYVSGFAIIITNVAAATDIFRKFEAELHAKSHEAAQERLSRDATNKPQL